MLPSSPIEILIVDDDPTVARLIEAVIAHRFGEQIRLKTVADPQAAREWLESEIVDLLLTDLEMPGMNGLTLLRCAKRRNAWTQVFLITGHSTLNAVVDAMDMGATDYLLKPVRETELVEAVGQAIRRLERWREAVCHGANNVDHVGAR